MATNNYGARHWYGCCGAINDILFVFTKKQGRLCYQNVCMILRAVHYNDVIMDVIAPQITSLTIFYSTVYSDADQRKHQSSALLDFVWPGNSPAIREFPAQMASKSENVSIWWRHHGINMELKEQNAYKKHSIVRPWGRGLECLW